MKTSRKRLMSLVLFVLSKTQEVKNLLTAKPLSVIVAVSLTEKDVKHWFATIVCRQSKQMKR